MAVQATFYEHTVEGKRRMVIHLLNDQSSWGRHSLSQQTWPTREEVLPVYGIRVELPGVRAKQVRLEPGGTRLPIRRGDVPWVEAPKLGIHSMVVVDL